MRQLVMYNNPVLEKKIEDFVLSKIPNYHEKSWEEKKVIYENLVRACRNCSLRYDTGYNSIPNIINKDSFALFVGRNPCKAEAMVNAIVSAESKQGILFKKYLSILGLGESEVSVLNMACCHGKGNRPPTQSEINRCVAFKKMEMSLVGDKYKIVFAMGNDALRWFFGINAPGVLQSIGDVYKVVINGREVVIVPVLHPSHVLIEPERKEDTIQILKRSRDIIMSLRD